MCITLILTVNSLYFDVEIMIFELNRITLKLVVKTN